MLTEVKKTKWKILQRFSVYEKEVICVSTEGIELSNKNIMQPMAVDYGSFKKGKEISLPIGLIDAATKEARGNFSNYVEGLIRADLDFKALASDEGKLRAQQKLLARQQGQVSDKLREIGLWNENDEWFSHQPQEKQNALQAHAQRTNSTLNDQVRYQRNFENLYPRNNVLWFKHGLTELETSRVLQKPSLFKLQDNQEVQVQAEETVEVLRKKITRRLNYSNQETKVKPEIMSLADAL